MAVGGDLQTLQELHRTLDTSATQIETVAGDITTKLQNTVWTGTNSEKFREAWETFKPTLTPNLYNALIEARDDVKNQHNNLAIATGEADRI